MCIGLGVGLVALFVMVLFDGCSEIISCVYQSIVAVQRPLAEEDLREMSSPILVFRTFASIAVMNVRGIAGILRSVWLIR